MQFAVEASTQGGIRLGKIAFGAGGSLDTPLCLLYARSGAVPHLAKDVAKDIPNLPRSSLFCLPAMYEEPGTNFASDGIHKFLKLQEPHFSYLSVQDPAKPPPHQFNREAATCILTYGGFQKVSVSDHLKVVEALRPTAFECLCDAAPSNSNSTKRITKSVNRTLSFLDQTLEAMKENVVLRSSAVLGAVVGGCDVASRTLSAAETAKRPVDGFVLEMNDGVECGVKGALSEVLGSCAAVLPSDKPRFIHGVGSPAEVLTAVECGMDVFDGCYPYTVTGSGCALTFPLQQLLSTDEPVGGQGGRRGKGQEQPLAMQLSEERLCVRGEREGGRKGREERKRTSDGFDTLSYHMQFWKLPKQTISTRFADDLDPLVAGCVCYTCQNHSRAYLHHLLDTKEMLAEVLLMIHNLTHYLQFFANLRESLKRGVYEQWKLSLCQSNHNYSVPAQ